MTLQTAVPVSAAQGPSRVRKHRSALPTEAAGLLPCITNFHYSLPLRLLLRASSQQTLRYFTLDFVGGQAGTAAETAMLGQPSLLSLLGLGPGDDAWSSDVYLM